MCEGGVYQAREWGWGEGRTGVKHASLRWEKVQGTGEIDNNCVEWGEIRGERGSVRLDM